MKVVVRWPLAGQGRREHEAVPHAAHPTPLQAVQDGALVAFLRPLEVADGCELWLHRAVEVLRRPAVHEPLGGLRLGRQLKQARPGPEIDECTNLEQLGQDLHSTAAHDVRQTNLRGLLERGPAWENDSIRGLARQALTNT